MGLQRRGIVLETLGGLLVRVRCQAVIVGGGKKTVLEVVIANRQGAPVVPLIIREYGCGRAHAKYSSVGEGVIQCSGLNTRRFENFRIRYSIAGDLP